MCKKKGKTEKNEILMLFLFRGGYLTESNKLGHEIINLFKADNENHYIYVVPWGHVSKEHVNKIGTIILARHVGNNQVEIIAKAKVKGNAFPGVEDSHSKKATQEERKIRKDKQREKCKDIFYGGECITDIYQFDEDGDEQGVLVSYEVEDFCFSKVDTKTNQFPRLIYTDKKKGEEKKNEKAEKEGTDYLICMEGNMAKNTLKEYFSKEYKENDRENDKEKKEENKRVDYETLCKMVSNKLYWEKEDNSRPIESKDYTDMINSYSNILKIIGKEDSELVFSNWIYYYFSKLEILNSFISVVLQKKTTDDCKEEDTKVHKVDDSFTITREKDRIDIRIEDKSQVIIIENKIKSGINGKKTTDNKSDKKESQLSDYYDKVDKNEKDKKTNRPIHCFIFVPEYNLKTIEAEKNELTHGEKYHLISYEAIYNFFSNLRCDDKYIDDFRKALRRHASLYPDSLREDTYHKFLERINELKAKKNRPWIGGEKREKHFQ